MLLLNAEKKKQEIIVHVGGKAKMVGNEDFIKTKLRRSWIVGKKSVFYIAYVRYVNV